MPQKSGASELGSSPTLIYVYQKRSLLRLPDPLVNTDELQNISSPSRRSKMPSEGTSSSPQASAAGSPTSSRSFWKCDPCREKKRKCTPPKRDFEAGELCDTCRSAGLECGPNKRKSGGPRASAAAAPHHPGASLPPSPLRPRSSTTVFSSFTERNDVPFGSVAYHGDLDNLVEQSNVQAKDGGAYHNAQSYSLNCAEDDLEDQ